MMYRILPFFDRKNATPAPPLVWGIMLFFLGLAAGGYVLDKFL